MPITTSENDIKERLSIAYVAAVAAHAGCQYATLDLDKESVDVMVRPISGLKAQVNMQIKATSGTILVGNEIRYSLPIKNYNDLRQTIEVNPSYLVIVHLPGTLSDWLKLTPTQLVIFGCAYFGNLYNLPAVTNETAKTVRFPATQTFRAERLVEMLTNAPNRIGTGYV